MFKNQTVAYCLASLMLIFVVHSATYAQQIFERKETSVGAISLSITNVGTIGNPQTIGSRAGNPSLEYPLNSGQEHLFESGIWIGALYSGSIQLSSSAATSSSGYQTGSGGFEFTNDGSPIIERSSLTSSPLYSPLAVSHQDLIANFSDSRVAINTGSSNIPIFGHDQPLFADIELTSYNWNFGFTETFSILKWSITNNSSEDWDSVYVGMYANLINRNINSSIEGGSAFFNKLGVGYIDSLTTIYAFDASSTDEPSLNTYGGLTILGTEYRGRNYHPNNADDLVSNGLNAPSVTPSYWLFSAGSGVFQRPSDDQERYSRMSTTFPYDDNKLKLATDGRTAVGNYISLIAIGPFQNVAPGETIDIYTSHVAGLMPDDLLQVPNVTIDDDAYAQSNFVDNITKAFRTFRGEDANNNGVLDTGEDINGNGVLDRFLIPEPPTTPNFRVELEAGKAVLYWDKSAETSMDPVSGLQDFEGYRIYRTELGDDIRGVIGTNARIIKEYDNPGNSFGFNTGFSEVELIAPITFDDEPGIEYWYRYEVENLLSGWQYLFSLTAFDASFEGNEVESLESSVNSNSIRVFPGTPVNQDFNEKVGVYPNPYRVNASWDGNNALNRKLVFYNLPQRASIRIYTLSGDVVAEFDHNADTYVGDSRWFSDFSASNRKLPGGEHAWDLLSNSNQNLTTGLYLFTVKDLDSGDVQRGKFALIK